MSNSIKNPARFIRHIYNRVILEIEAVRAGAVSSLAKIGANVDEVTDSTIVLLNRCVRLGVWSIGHSAILHFFYPMPLFILFHVTLQLSLRCG